MRVTSGSTSPQVVTNQRWESPASTAAIESRYTTSPPSHQSLSGNHTSNVQWVQKQPTQSSHLQHDVLQSASNTRKIGQNAYDKDRAIHNNNVSSTSETNQATTVNLSRVNDPWPEHQRRKAAEGACRATIATANAERQHELNGKTLQTVPRPVRGKQQQQNIDSQSGNAESKVPNLTANGTQSQYTNSIQDSKNKNQDEEEVMMLSVLKALKAKNPALLRQLMASMDTKGEADALGDASAKTLSEAAPNPSTNGKHTTVLTANSGLGSSLQNSSPIANRISRGDAAASSGSAPTGKVVPADIEASHQGASAKTSAAVSQVSKEKVVWPEKAKLVLGSVAADFLNRTPGNEANQIDSITMISIFNTNPTYSGLCERLETRGLKVDRGSFARALLAAIPSPNTTVKCGNEDKQRTTDQQKTQKIDLVMEQNPTAIEKSLAAGPMDVEAAKPSNVKQYNNGSWQRFQEGTQSHPTSNKDTVQSSVASVGETLAQSRKSSDENQPVIAATSVNKANAARKRVFADLVDLSQLSDEDEPMFSGPNIAMQQSNSISRPQNAHSSESQRHQRGSVDFAENMTSQPSHGSPSYMSSLGGRAIPLVVERQQFGAHDCYVETHPPLDSHLHGSGVPRVPQSGFVVTGQKVVQPLQRKKALLRSSYDIRTIARDVLLAAGRHPDMFGLNSHLEIMKSQIPDISNNSDLSTLRWDLIDPGDPLPLLQIGDEQDHTMDEADDEEEENEELTNEPLRRATKPVADQQRKGHINNGSKERQPRMQLKYLPASPEQRSSTSRDLSLQTNTTKKTYPTPPKRHQNDQMSDPASGNRLGYKAFKQAAGGVRRGHPVGWRKHLHMKGGAGSSTVASKIRKPSPEAQFLHYECKWQNCGSGLHNLGTLRRHVQKLHQKPLQAGGYECLWASCPEDQSSKPQRLHFRTQIDWWTHLEAAHFRDLQWSHGDGPASGLSDAHDSEQSESYLTDSQGRRVTPRVVTPPRGSEGRRERRVRFASSSTSVLPTSGTYKGPAAKRVKEARAAEEALRRRKEQIGFGLDKGGSTLANAKRRQGFIDDEDLEEVLEDESNEADLVI